MAFIPKNEKSFWREFYPPEPVYPKLNKDITVDVAIVGAGITGLTAGYLLKRQGLTVAVVEKHTVAGGTSGRTTGKVTSQHNLNYDTLQQRFGKQIAKTYGQANQTAIERIENIIKKEKIACDWQRDDHYVYTTDPNKVDEFKKEATAAKAAGLPASFVSDTPLPFAVTAAIKCTGQAKINMQRYLLGLAKFIHANGSYVFENSTAIGIRAGNPGRVKTRHGKITAKHIIVASSVPTIPLIARVGYSIHQYPSESYIVSGKPTKKLKGMYISPDKDNYSLLPISIDGDDTLLVCGEGHLWGLRGNRKARFERLAAYAQNHFGVNVITNKWSDRDYLTYDGIPLAGRLYPWLQQLYVGTAYKKWGLTNGTVAAIILSDMITGAKNDWAGMYSPRRPTLRNAFRRTR